MVSLPQVEALLAQAPDLPHAEQLARLAIARGALTPPLIVPRRPLISLPTPPTRYRVRPVTGEPLADALRAQLDPLVKADDALNAEAAGAGPGAVSDGERAGRGVAARRLAALHPRRRCQCPPGRRPGPARGERRLGCGGGVGVGPCLVASERLQRVGARLSRRRRAQQPARASLRRLLLGGAIRAGLPQAAGGRAAAQSRGAVARELLRPGCARDARHRHAHSRSGPCLDRVCRRPSQCPARL